MTEREAIEAIKRENESFLPLSQADFDTAMSTAIKALEELALYKEGGLCLVPAELYKAQCNTLDELQRQQREKQVETEEVCGVTVYTCPVCGMYLYNEQIYCDRCGQRIGWEE